MWPGAQPFCFRDPHFPQTHLHITTHFFLTSRLSQGVSWKRLISSVQLQGPVPETIGTWLFLWSASKGMTVGAGSSRFLTHLWTGKCMRKGENGAAKRRWQVNASPRMSWMSKSLPVTLKSRGNRGDPRGLWTGLRYKMIESLRCALVKNAHLLLSAKGWNHIIQVARILFLCDIQGCWSSQCLTHKVNRFREQEPQIQASSYHTPNDTGSHMLSCEGENKRLEMEGSVLRNLGLYVQKLWDSLK